MRKLLALGLATLVTALGILPSAHAAEASRLGRPIDDFTLKSHFGKEYALHDFADRDVVVVAFLGAECPLAKLYADRLVEMQKAYADRKVAFVAVMSNRQDSIAEITAARQTRWVPWGSDRSPAA